MLNYWKKEILMPFCPQCHYEYVDKINMCPDCQVKLVDELPANIKKNAHIELVSLHSLPGFIYGEMVKEALEKEGIHSMLISDPLTTGLLTKGTHGAGHECQILVEKKDKARAESILHTMMDHI
jgi:hypothetical protein